MAPILEVKVNCNWLTMIKSQVLRLDGKLRPKKKGFGCAEAFDYRSDELCLLERGMGGDGGELCTNLAAERSGATDDGESDQAGNQRVLDGRGAGFVLKETSNEVLHV
jgi:hypothetical protein